ncbi:unnamed protein product [marine sediment metagenome]|uniref:DUF7448 domain-containing protein n=1 Tax=marine sediment metagenome TaxID=412755 RepID=X0SVI7_9ZZZZ
MSSVIFIEAEDLKGKEFSSIKKIEYQGCDAIEFISDSGDKFIMNHGQDCCEEVYIEDICGDLDDLTNSPLLMSEKVSNNETPDGVDIDSLFHEYCLWTFYKFATTKGYVTIRWYGGTDSCYALDVDIWKEVKYIDKYSSIDDLPQYYFNIIYEIISNSEKTKKSKQKVVNKEMLSYKDDLSFEQIKKEVKKDRHCSGLLGTVLYLLSEGYKANNNLILESIDIATILSANEYLKDWDNKKKRLSRLKKEISFLKKHAKKNKNGTFKKRKIRKVSKKEFEEKLELAFYGSGGGIVLECLEQSAIGDRSIKDELDDIIEDSLSDDEIFEDLSHLPEPTNDEERLIRIEEYIGEKCCFPEICGSIAGILYRDGKLKECLEFLEVFDITEPRRWDS